jgi:hypothetical protein
MLIKPDNGRRTWLKGLAEIGIGATGAYAVANVAA